MGTLYCLGDSLTFGMGVRHQDRWTNLAMHEANCHIVNLGLSGDTTAGMLVRLRMDIFPRHPINSICQNRPAVLLMGGSNDIFYSGSFVSAKANMGAMIHQTLSAGLEPVVGIPLPIVPSMVAEKWAPVTDFEQAAAMLEEYSVWLKSFCASFSVRVIDFRADFLAEDGSTRDELYLDGLHPNQTGHRVMARRITEFLSGM